MLNKRLSFNIAFYFFLILRFFSEYIDRLINSQISNFLGAYLILIFIIQIFNSKKINISSFNYMAFWLAFCGSIFISSFLSPLPQVDFSVTFKEILKYSSVGIVFYLVYTNHKNTSSFYPLIKIIYIGVLLSCLFSIAQGVLGFGKNVYADGIARPSGFMSDPVIFGVMLVMAYCLFDTYNQINNSKFTLHLTLILILIICTLYFTKARSAWIMFFLYFFLKFYFTKGNMKAKILFPALIIASLPLLLSRFQDLQGITLFIESLSYNAEVNYGRIESSFHWRIYQWIHLISFWSERILLGYGSTSSTLLGLNNLSAHSSIVELLVEQGILGLCLILFFLKTYLFSDFSKNSKLIKYLFLSLIPVAVLSLSFINQTFNLMFLSILIAYKLRLKNEETQR